MNINHFCTLGRTNAVFYLQEQSKRYLTFSRSRRSRNPVSAGCAFFWSQQFVKLAREIKGMNSREFNALRQDLKLWQITRANVVHALASVKRVQRKARKARLSMIKVG